MNDKLTKYRDYLVQTEQKVSESYDKTIITLSVGALGVSFAFLKYVIGTNPVQSKGVLVVAWTFLTVSLVSVVLSLLFGTMAFRKAIKQVDEKKISDVVAGGWFARVTAILHISGVLFLALGFMCLGIFLYNNF